MAERIHLLASIAHEYRLLSGRLLKKKAFMRPTARGYFSGARIDDIHAIFEKIRLEKYKNFIDLGSGDGRVVLMAAAYTTATGVEADVQLIATARRMRKKLARHAALKNASFVKKSYFDVNLRDYDVIFINPDKPLYELEKKLHAEMKKNAILVVYNSIYQPVNLKLKQKIGVGPGAGCVYVKNRRSIDRRHERSSY